MDALREEYGNQIIEENEGFQAVKNMVRTDIQNKLGRSNAERIFLVFNRVIKVEQNGQQHRAYDTSADYDFDLLVEQIQDDMLGEGGLTAEKGKAFILAIGAISKSAIRATANVFRNQSWGWSTLSGVIGAVPIPGISLTCDAMIIIDKAMDYFMAFGLNPLDYLGEGSAAEKMENLVRVMSASMGPRVAAILAAAIGSIAVEEG
ncbi:unnamed protein product, partial [Rotaria sordida]